MKRTTRLLVLVLLCGPGVAQEKPKETAVPTQAPPAAQAAQPETILIDDIHRARLLADLTKIREISAGLESYKAAVLLEAQNKIVAEVQKHVREFQRLEASAEKIYESFLASRGLKKDEWVFDAGRMVVKRKTTDVPK